jgi:hypothetical protein
VILFFTSTTTDEVRRAARATVARRRLPLGRALETIVLPVKLGRRIT